jgi:hypothetical protein
LRGISKLGVKEGREDERSGNVACGQAESDLEESVDFAKLI